MKSIKQIIIAHYTLPPIVGGVENIIGPQAEAFAQQGYLVTLLSGEGKIEGKNIKTSLVPDLSPNNPHIQKVQRILKFGSLPEDYEYRLHNLEKKIETQIGDIDTIIIHNIMSMPFNLTATEAFWNYIQKSKDKQFYLWTHDLAWLMDDHKNYLYNRKPWMLLKSVLPNVHYITISEYRRRQMAELLGIPRKKIIVVPNVLKYQDFLSFHHETTQIISQLTLFHRYPFILIPARQLPRKNIERSIQIIAKLKESFPDVLGIITGQTELINNEVSPYSIELKRLVKELGVENHILFLDELFDTLNISQVKNRDVVHDLYFVAHLVLYLSHDEGFGLPILEAGAARTPIAVSKIPVFRETAEDGVLYLPTDESSEFNANRLVKFLKENLSRSDLLFRRVFSQYNWQSYWHDYLKPIFGK
ncbi:glycosyltransferase [bacterium]|nr:glycosyltransferase [bacterium]MBU1065476.1 glycosyltransferase [bacterium]MBU1634845.1 glycosyltransferase [bacterium]MBU1873149.1 glycosyltransferase [bacterium]